MTGPATFDEALDALREIGANPQRIGASWSIRCPHPDHDDDYPSASIRAGNRRPYIIHCHVCSPTDPAGRRSWFAAVLARLAARTPMTPASGARHHTGGSGAGAYGRPVCAYVYRDASGAPVAKKTRFERPDGGKTFAIARPYGEGWVSGLGMGGAIEQLPPYRLPELLASSGPVLITEGEKDSDNAAAAGWVSTCAASGANANPASVRLPSDLSAFTGRDVVIVRDNDRAGIGNALAWRAALAGIAASVRIVRPAVDTEKSDLTDHLEAGYGWADLVPDDDPRPTTAAGDDPQEPAPDVDPPAPVEQQAPARVHGGGKDGPPVAELLVRLALARYRLIRTPDGEAFALPRGGPAVVRPLRGGHGSLRGELAGLLRREAGRVAGQQALADALLAIESMALDGPPVSVHLRAAHDPAAGVSWLDLGRADGLCVAVSAAGWALTDTPAVLFRRSELTCELPEPVRGGSLSALWALLNVAPDHRPLVAAWLVCALFPDLPSPVAAVDGEQGSGKSTACRILAGVLDPAFPQTRKPPRDEGGWVVAASGSLVVALDNVSHIPDWLSDSLCRAVTGDGDVRRRLYTDGGLTVFAFKRSILLNGIEFGSLRDDLADRLLPIGLHRIPPESRRLEAELDRLWREAHPGILGAVLDLAVSVLRELPTVHMTERPRMADFALILAAVDRVLGTDGLGMYRALGDELAAAAVTGDPLLIALAASITYRFEGTAADVLRRIDDGGGHEKGWPRSGQAMAARLRRHSPTLRRLGWTIEQTAPDPHDKRRRWVLIPPDGMAAPEPEPDPGESFDVEDPPDYLWDGDDDE